MKIPATQRLVVEDFPEQKQWISPMFYVINRFITFVVQILNRGILFKDNVMGQEESFDFTFVSAADSLPRKFKWNLSIRPERLEIISASAETSTTPITPVILLPCWEYTDTGEVSITSLVQISTSGAADLSASTRYRIKVRATP